jgi:hypothetical protein
VSAPDLTRLYRAYVTPLSASQPELCVFVEAASRDGARQRLCALVALITLRRIDEVADAVYNLFSAAELIDEGMSDRRECRLFECSWSRARIGYVEAPLFLVSNPLPLLAAWLRTRAGEPQTFPAAPTACAIVAAALADREGY